MTSQALEPEKKGMSLLLKLVLGLCVLAAGIGIGIGIGAGIWEGSNSNSSNNGSIVDTASQSTEFCQTNITEPEWLLTTPAERLFISTDSKKSDAFEANSTMFNIILSGVPDTVLAFTDRPVRRAEPAAISQVIEILNSDAENTYNAVVTFSFKGTAVQIPINMLSVVALGNNSYALNATLLQLPGPLANEADQNLLDATEFNSSNIQMVYDSIHAGYETTEDVFLFIDDFGSTACKFLPGTCEAEQALKILSGCCLKNPLPGQTNDMCCDLCPDCGLIGITYLNPTRETKCKEGVGCFYHEACECWG